MNRKLSTEDIQYLARVQKIEVQYLLKVKNLLDPKKVRSLQIRYEYRERVKNSNLQKRQIIELLMKRYMVSKSYIESILYEKKLSVNTKECVICGALTSYYRWSKYDGRCKKCMRY